MSLPIATVMMRPMISLRPQALLKNMTFELTAVGRYSSAGGTRYGQIVELRDSQGVYAPARNANSASSVQISCLLPLRPLTYAASSLAKNAADGPLSPTEAKTPLKGTFLSLENNSSGV